MRDEGLRVLPYRDTEGYWTIGIGHNLNVPLSMHVVNEIFKEDAKGAYEACIKCFGNSWKIFPMLTKLAVLNMMFNLGLQKFLMFEKMIRLLREGRFDEASTEALKSKWAVQVKSRSIRVTELMRGKDIYYLECE